MTVLTAPLRRARVAALRVPQITLAFWVIKGLSTALGESTSDYLVVTIDPVLAVTIGFGAFVVALAVQLTRGHYLAWAYWLTVVMVGVFGTMAADVVHVVLGLSYAVVSLACAITLAAVFWSWHRVEGTLSVHTIDTWRRELFYWAAVMATFATGTAVGDLAAITFHLGYLGALLAFAVALVVPGIGFRFWRWNPILAFWVAYVLTRPLGASFADWTGKSVGRGGLGWGDGPVSLVLALAIVALVGWLTVSRADVQVTSQDAVTEAESA